MQEIRFKIIKHLEVLSTNEKSGWRKEVNIISWNGNPEKLDIRDWNEDHTKLSKGVTLTSEEAKALGITLADLFRR